MNVRHVLITACSLLLATSVAALPLTGFGQGTIHFPYQQWPIGDFQGQFDAEGPAGGAGNFISPGYDQGAGGVAGDLPEGGATLVAYGAARNPDDSLDLLVLVVHTATDTLVPGTSYEVSVEDPVCQVWFLDDVTGITLPDDLTQVDWEDLVGAVEAAHKFVAYSGEVRLNVLDATQVEGAISGRMFDLNDTLLMIQTETGTFHLDAAFTGNRALGMGELKLLYR